MRRYGQCSSAILVVKEELVKEVENQFIIYGYHGVNKAIKRPEEMCVMIYVVLPTFAHVPRVKEVGNTENNAWERDQPKYVETSPRIEKDTSKNKRSNTPRSPYTRDTPLAE